MSELEQFRRETRAWLEANCPPEMRKAATADDDACWGGRNWIFKSDDQRVWIERARRGLDRAGLAEGIWRRRPRPPSTRCCATR